MTATATGPVPPAWPGGARGLRIALATADPGLGRLRSATTTVVVLAVTAGIVLGGALLVGGPVSSAVTGVVVAFVTGIAARDQPLPAQAVTTAWTAGSVSLVAVISALLGGASTTPGIVVFVGLGVTVVFLQRLGPRGVAPGMAGFIAFLATTLTGLTPSGLPLAVGGAVLAAVVVTVTRWLLRPRHPERAARHALDAVEAQAAFAVLTLAAVLRDDDDRDKALRHAHRRLASLRRTVSIADDRLAETDTPALAGTDNTSIGVRVFDLRLALEHLAALLADPPAEPGLAGRFDEVGRALLAPRDAPGRWDRVDAVLASAEEGRVGRTLARAVEEWRRPPDRLDEPDPADDDAAPPPAASPMSDTVRRAVQVGLAVALAALVGQWISSMQWFFAVVIAFVVFISSSSRGQVLSEGWQRTVGTLVGVVAGIGLAALLDGAAVPTVVLLAVCLFGALYVVGLSSTALMFFVTTAIALVYGLIGRFTVDVLLLRLAETAVGAGIGIAVSFLVLPTRTRTTFADATVRFLRALRVVVDESADVLTHRGGTGHAVQTVDEGSARELRDAYAAVELAAGPLTDGLAGVLDRTGHRDSVRVVAACDHHARLLLRLARRHDGVAADDAAEALRVAAGHVSGRVDTLAQHLDRQVDGSGDLADDHGRIFGALDEEARRLGESCSDVSAVGAHPDAERVSAGDVLEAVGGRLRAIDRAVTDIARR